MHRLSVKPFNQAVAPLRHDTYPAPAIRNVLRAFNLNDVVSFSHHSSQFQRLLTSLNSAIMSSNPEKPPIQFSGQDPQNPQQYQQQQQQQQQQPYFPPPPSGPPPEDQQQYAPQSATGQHPPGHTFDGQGYTSGDQKPPILPQTEQQYYPPPPPGQPPSQQQYPSNADVGLGPNDNLPTSYKPSDDYEGPPPLPGPRPTQHQQQGYNPAGSGNPLLAGQATTQTTQTTHERPHRTWGDRLSEMGHKAAAPINAFANKLGAQSFLPTTMDKECEKAANILRSFCKEGIASDAAAQGPQGTQGQQGHQGYQGSPTSAAPEPTYGARPVSPNKQPRALHGQRAIVKIPSKVIQRAQGLAIFTTARVSYGFSGATGSGILIARRPDGSWSPPSGIQVHTLGAGFSIGVDIYDCVCVINSREALEAFKSTRVSLGPDVAVTAGPYGAGGNVQIGYGGGGRKSGEHRREEEDLVYDRPPSQYADGKPFGEDDDKLKPPRKDKDRHRRSSSGSFKPVFTYVKSRGFYAGVQVDGTVITERRDANAAFYGQRVGVEQILRGEVPPHGAKWPAGSPALYEALRVAESQKPLPEANLPPPPHPTPAGVAPPPQSGADPNVAAPGGQYGQLGNYPTHPVGQATGGQFHGSPHMTGGGGVAGPPSGAQGDELPGYVDDGIQRPGVGDRYFEMPCDDDSPHELHRQSVPKRRTEREYRKRREGPVAKRSI
ncbi:hypothetical protein SODALDRAFT_382040 [Sodiomyces alkalinus F11]|uniref:Ysc84 actin-binding domain-containing protein n=1 Tax=Sodiomyces alkalinus (strain CBS 110278 / VKM F-3762 / F11) TaxID=1314773 RepID=A0A3N2PKQ1_SODAK|nr:hypothetical protein SODALDRAFT_382040 [Sodiomyces alkalinus F11]ROT35103.1 hypothetical protein SODALDRAFT_382040 [Sodiomyces alkalinus F11]